MSLLRILLEGDHGFGIRYSPMTYQHAPRQRVHLVYNVGR